MKNQEKYFCSKCIVLFLLVTPFLFLQIHFEKKSIQKKHDDLTYQKTLFFRKKSSWNCLASSHLQRMINPSRPCKKQWNNDKENVKISNHPQPSDIKKLFDACSNGDYQTVKTFIEEGIDPNRRDFFANTPLHLAAQNGHSDIVQSLINNGAEVNAKTHLGDTPLHWAAKNADKNTIELLIESGAELHAKTRLGNTPLHWAAKNDRRDTVLLLIEKNAQVNAENNRGNTPLHWAAHDGCRDTVRLLIEKKANVNAKNHLKKTPLHLAAQNGHLDIVEHLIKQGAFIDTTNSDEETPFHSTAQSLLMNQKNNLKKMAVIECFLQYNTVKNTPNKDGITPLYNLYKFFIQININDSIMKKRCFSLIKSLIKKIIESYPKEYANHPQLHETLMAKNFLATSELFKDSIKKHFFINDANSGIKEFICTVILIIVMKKYQSQWRNKEGNTFFHNVCLEGDILSIFIFLETDFDLTIQNASKQTPLHCLYHYLTQLPIVSSTRTEIKTLMKMMIQKVPEISLQDYQNNPCLNMTCQKTNRKSFIEAFFKKLQLNLCNDQGETILHQATALNDFEIVKLCVENGAKVNVKNNKKETPLHLAAQNGYSDIVQSLIKNGADIWVYHTNKQQ